MDTAERCTVSYSADPRGRAGTPDFAVYLRDAAGIPISPIHDVPLFVTGNRKILNMVVQSARWSNAVMEVSQRSRLNPIKQKAVKGRLEFVPNFHPCHGFHWNFGILPQTWCCDPGQVNKAVTGMAGYGQTLDVCEIGHKVHYVGEVVQVKVLGAIAFFGSSGRCAPDKILAIDVSDPLASAMESLEDVDAFMPDYLRTSAEWWKKFHAHTNPSNVPTVGVSASVGTLQTEIALTKYHAQWKAMMDSGSGLEGMSRTCVRYKCGSMVSGDEALGILEGAPKLQVPAPLNSSIDKWMFLDVKQAIGRRT